MTKKKQISCGAKSIVLTDEQMVDEINELLAKSDYNYNFNKLANDLLARGIDSFKVDDKPTEEVKPKEKEWEEVSAPLPIPGYAFNTMTHNYPTDEREHRVFVDHQIHCVFAL